MCSVCSVSANRIKRYGRTDANAPVMRWYIAVITVIWLVSNAATAAHLHSHLNCSLMWLFCCCRSFPFFQFKSSAQFHVPCCMWCACEFPICCSSHSLKLQMNFEISSLSKYQLHLLNSRFTNKRSIIVTSLCDCIHQNVQLKIPPHWTNYLIQVVVVFFRGVEKWWWRRWGKTKVKGILALKWLVYMVKFMS